MVYALRIALLFQLFAVSAWAVPPDPEQFLSEKLRSKLQVPFEVVWGSDWQAYDEVALRHYIAPLREALELVSELAPPNLALHPFRFQEPAPGRKTYLHIVLANSQDLHIKTKSGYDFPYRMQRVQNSRTISIEQDNPATGEHQLGIFMVLRLDHIAEVTARGKQKNDHETIRRRLFAELTELYGIPAFYMRGTFDLNAQSRSDEAVFLLEIADTVSRNWEWFNRPENKAKLPNDIADSIPRYKDGMLQNLEASRVMWQRTLGNRSVVPVDYSRWGQSSFFSSGPGRENEKINTSLTAAWGLVEKAARETPKSLYTWDQDYGLLIKKTVAFHTLTTVEFTQATGATPPPEVLHGYQMTQDSSGRWTLNVYFFLDRILIDAAGKLRHENEMKVRWALAAARAQFGVIPHFLQVPLNRVANMASQDTHQIALSAFQGSSDFLHRWMIEATRSSAPEWVLVSEASRAEKESLACALRIAGAQ